jgi:hypothetical protein
MRGRSSKYTANRASHAAQMLSGGERSPGLTITFASFDWLMSLEPHWFSTITAS